MSTLGPDDQLEAPQGQWVPNPDMEQPMPAAPAQHVQMTEPGPGPARSGVLEDDENATLDFFLGNTPEETPKKSFELTRENDPDWGFHFTIQAIDEDQMKNCINRSTTATNRKNRREGKTERDFTLLNRLVAVEGIVAIKRRLRSKEDAEATGKPEFGGAMTPKDEAIMERYGKPEEFMRLWFLPGEITNISNMISTLSGYDSEAIVEAGN